MTIPAGDDLIRDIVAGREEAFERLYDLFGERMMRVALGLCRTQHDAEDAVQDVFVGLVHASGALGKVQNLNAYLMTAVHRAAFRRNEQRRNQPTFENDALDTVAANESNSAAEPHESARLERALKSLPAEQQAIIALKIDGGLSFEEAATVLNVSINTAASRYRYALEKLGIRWFMHSSLKRLNEGHVMDSNSDESLPPELQHLETRLAGRTTQVEFSGARARTLLRVKQELAAKELARRALPWRVLLSIAAVILLCINLSMSAVNDTGLNLTRPVSAVSAEQVAKIRALVPDLSESEAFREALLISARKQLLAVPDPGGNADLGTRIKENHGLPASVD